MESYEEGPDDFVICSLTSGIAGFVGGSLLGYSTVRNQPVNDLAKMVILYGPALFGTLSCAESWPRSTQKMLEEQLKEPHLYDRIATLNELKEFQAAPAQQVIRGGLNGLLSASIPTAVGYGIGYVVGGLAEML